MFLFCLCFFTRNLLKSWEEYYAEAKYQEYVDGTAIELDAATQNIYVHDANFIHLKQDAGGAIMVQTEDALKILIESAQFYNCSADSISGAIYINAGSSSCVLDTVCSNTCYLTKNSNAHFAYIVSSLYNFIKFSTVVNCGNSNQDTESMVFLYGGTQEIDNLNVSYSKSGKYGIILQNPEENPFEYSFLVEVDILQNSLLHLVSGDNEISNLNIIQNTAANAIVEIDGKTVAFTRCYVALNDATYFSVLKSGSLSVVNCYFDEDIQYSGAITLIKDHPISDLNTMDFINTYYCEYSKFYTPAATPPMTKTTTGEPPIQTPLPTPPMTQTTTGFPPQTPLPTPPMTQTTTGIPPQTPLPTPPMTKTTTGIPPQTPLPTPPMTKTTTGIPPQTPMPTPPMTKTTTGIPPQTPTQSATGESSESGSANSEQRIILISVLVCVLLVLIVTVVLIIYCFHKRKVDKLTALGLDANEALLKYESSGMAKDTPLVTVE